MDNVAQALENALETLDERDGKEANVVDGLLAIARAGEAIAYALHRLGIADRSTPLGAIEYLAVQVADAARALDALDGTGEPVARAIDDLGDTLARVAAKIERDPV